MSSEKLSYPFDDVITEEVLTNLSTEFGREVIIEDVISVRVTQYQDPPQKWMAISLRFEEVEVMMRRGT